MATKKTTDNTHVVVPITHTRKELPNRTGFHGFVLLERLGAKSAGRQTTYRVISSYDTLLLALTAAGIVASEMGARGLRWPQPAPAADQFVRGAVYRCESSDRGDDFGLLAVVYWPEPKDERFKAQVEGGVVDFSVRRRVFEFSGTASDEAVAAARARLETGELTELEQQANQPKEGDELCECGERRDDHPKVGVASNGCRGFARVPGRWRAPRQVRTTERRPRTIEEVLDGMADDDPRWCSPLSKAIAEAHKPRVVETTVLSPPPDRSPELREHDAAMGRALARGNKERELDAEFAPHPSTPRPHNKPNAFRSVLSREEWGHTAHLKLEYSLADDGGERRPNENDWSNAIRNLADDGTIYDPEDDDQFDCVPHEVVELRAYTFGRRLHVRAWLRMKVVMGKVGGQLSEDQTLALHSALGGDPSQRKRRERRVARRESGWLTLWTHRSVDGRLVACEEYSEEWTKKICGWVGL